MPENLHCAFETQAHSQLALLFRLQINKTRRVTCSMQPYMCTKSAQKMTCILILIAYYGIAGIIRGGQFSRVGEPFVLRWLFVGFKIRRP